MGEDAEDEFGPIDLNRREAFVLVFSSGAGITALSVGSEKATDSEPEYDGDEVKAHVSNAAEYFQQNYELLSSPELSLPGHLYSLNIELIDENLNAASKELTRAKDAVGDAPDPPLLTEANNYLQFQQLAREAFDLSGTSTNERIIDTVLEQIIEPFNMVVSSNGLTGSGVSLEQDPYNLQYYRSQFSNNEPSIPFTKLGDYVSHSAKSVIVAVHTGLETLSELNSLYRMVQAHALLPDISEKVFMIDSDLSQTSSLETIADEHKRMFSELLAKIGMKSDETFSEEIAAKQIGDLSFTAGEIKHSYNGLSGSFSKVESSLAALANGDHERSTSLWSDGIEAMYVARQESPVF